MLPASYLSQNFPNPFNPMTSIGFGLNESAVVSLRIYDAGGRLIRAMVDSHRRVGTYREVWDDTDASGRAAASGIYFYRLDAGPSTRAKKMVLLR